MAKIYKIYPAIGFARVGNADLTPALFNNLKNHFNKSEYKVGGKILPVPANFQVWEHELDTAGVIIRSNPIDATHLKVEKIEWRVHLANKKAAFYKFEYKDGDTSQHTSGLRNSRPNQWKIDPGPVTITGKNTHNKKIVHKKGATEKIPDLQIGSLWTDGFGDLHVFGGKGISKSAARTPVTIVNDTFNTPTWFDDVSDGPVTVHLKFKDQKKPTPVAPAWVIVGPPDFAPPLENIVTLYDVLCDLLVRNKIRLSADNLKLLKHYPHLEEIYKDFSSNSFDKLTTYKPHFHDDILPILRRGNILKYVSQLASGGHGVTINIGGFATLTDAQRKNIFGKMRKPFDGSGGNMPQMHGDAYGQTGQPDQFLYITKTQHELLRRWSEGDFLKTTTETPVAFPFWMDVASLRAALGGAFAPGIEVGWMFRNPKLYSSPFRIDHTAKEQYKARGFRAGTISPGYFTKQLADPWQADFMACSLTNGVAWWPAQRPDDVYATADFTKPMVPWFRDSAGNLFSNYQDMVDKWHEMGFVLSDPGGGYVEKYKN